MRRSNAKCPVQGPPLSDLPYRVMIVDRQHDDTKRWPSLRFTQLGITNTYATDTVQAPCLTRVSKTYPKRFNLHYRLRSRACRQTVSPSDLIAYSDLLPIRPSNPVYTNYSRVPNHLHPNQPLHRIMSGPYEGRFSSSWEDKSVVT